MGGRACKGEGAREELLHHRFFALFNKKFTVLVLMLMVSRKGRPKPMPCPVNTCSQIPDTLLYQNGELLTGTVPRLLQVALVSIGASE